MGGLLKSVNFFFLRRTVYPWRTTMNNLFCVSTTFLDFLLSVYCFNVRLLAIYRNHTFCFAADLTTKTKTLLKYDGFSPDVYGI